MKNGLMADYARSKSNRTGFFLRLLETKRPKEKTASEKEWLIYLAKFYSGFFYLKLSGLYCSFFSWLTQYYPFSLFYRDKLFHHNNLKVNKLMLRMEKEAKKTGIEIIILSGSQGETMAEMFGHLDPKTKNKSEIIVSLEIAFQKKWGNIYVRDNEENVRILIPNETFGKII